MRAILLFIVCIPFLVKAQTNTFPSSGNVGIGTTNPRGLFDIGGSGNIYLSNSTTTGTSQAVYLPGNIYISPYDGSNISYLQARRSDNSGSTSLQMRTYNSGNLVDAMLIDQNGNVGIGTTSPRGLFDIGRSGDIYLSNSTTTGTAQSVYLPGHIYIAPYNGSNISYLQARRSDNSGSTSLQIRTYNSGNLVDAMLINQNGNVGIGTTSPRGLFDIGGSGDIYLSNSTTTGTAQSVYLPGHIYIAPYDGSNISYLQARRSDNSGSTSLQIRTYNSGNLVDAMLIDQNGNVAIGTSDAQGYKLAVNGDALFTKVKVKTYATWPDYVFHHSYKLRPLKDLANYIKQNNHLPDVPSANEVEKNGLDLGDNQALLLKKIEELTLYIIDQDKKITELQDTSKKLEEQSKSIESLTKQVEALKSLLSNK